MLASLMVLSNRSSSSAPESAEMRFASIALRVEMESAESGEREIRLDLKYTTIRDCAIDINYLSRSCCDIIRLG